MIIIVISNNSQKIKEIKTILAPLPYPIVSYKDIITHPLKIIENGLSFKENAIKKATALPQSAQTKNAIIIADDSGLEVAALNNRPGIYSARYGGENLTDQQRCNLLLNELHDTPNRQAQFTCVIALQLPNKSIKTVSGTVKGHITKKLSGSKGFGYDPVFIPKNYTQTFAKLGRPIKNQISHRTVALKKAAVIIQQYNSKIT